LSRSALFGKIKYVILNSALFGKGKETFSLSEIHYTSFTSAYSGLDNHEYRKIYLFFTFVNFTEDKKLTVGSNEARMQPKKIY
jgi:hypothetical protein